MTAEQFTTHPVHESLGGPQIAFGFDLSKERRTATADELADLRRKYSSLLIQLDRLQPQLARAEKLPALTTSDTPIADSAHADEWTIKEILGHMIDTDRDIWWPRISAILESGGGHAMTAAAPRFTTIDQYELVRRHRWQTMQLEDILAQLMRVRWACALKLAQLPATALEQSGTHDVYGDLTILQIIHLLIAHDAHYLSKIEEMVVRTRG